MSVFGKQKLYKMIIRIFLQIKLAKKQIPSMITFNSSDQDLLLPIARNLLTSVNVSASLNDTIISNLTNFLVPVAFGIILTVGLLGNILVISVV